MDDDFVQMAPSIVPHTALRCSSSLQDGSLSRRDASTKPGIHAAHADGHIQLVSKCSPAVSRCQHHSSSKSRARVGLCLVVSVLPRSFSCSTAGYMFSCSFGCILLNFDSINRPLEFCPNLIFYNFLVINLN